MAMSFWPNSFGHLLKDVLFAIITYLLNNFFYLVDNLCIKIIHF